MHALVTSAYMVRYTEIQTAALADYTGTPLLKLTSATDGFIALVYSMLVYNIIYQQCVQAKHLTCLKAFWLSFVCVSTINLLLNMLQSFAP